MFSVVNANKVMFSKGLRMLVGDVDAAKGACTPVGLLGENAVFNITPTYRQKTDRFPEVVVAEAIQGVTAETRIVLREWTTDNLRLALGLGVGDVTAVAGSEVVVTDEEYTVDEDGRVFIDRTGLSDIVVKEGVSTTHALDTDYVVIETATQTIIFALDGGGISPADDLKISYKYTPAAHHVLPIGKASTPTYYGIWLEEELTGSQTSKAEFQIYKARIGIDNGFQLNNAEQGGDIPLVIQAVLMPGKTDLGKLYNYA